MVALNNLGIILITIVAVVSVILLILIIIEKKLYKKVSKIKNTKNRFYIEKISKLTPSDPKKTLSDIDKIGRNFFREAFKTKSTAEYSELKDFFTKKNNKKVVEFCSIMDDLLYSGKKPEKKENQKLINILIDIIEKNKIISKAEKIALDKESQKKDKGIGRKIKNLLQKKGIKINKPKNQNPH